MPGTVKMHRSGGPLTALLSISRLYGDAVRDELCRLTKDDDDESLLEPFSLTHTPTVFSVCLLGLCVGVSE